MLLERAPYDKMADSNLQSPEGFSRSSETGLDKMRRYHFPDPPRAHQCNTFQINRASSEAGAGHDYRIPEAQ